MLVVRVVVEGGGGVGVLMRVEGEEDGAVENGFERSAVGWEGWEKAVLLALLALPNGLLGFLSVGWLESGWPNVGTAWLAVLDWAGCPKVEEDCKGCPNAGVGCDGWPNVVLPCAGGPKADAG